MNNIWSDMAIKNKILAGFSVIVLIFLGSSFYTLQQISESNEYSTHMAEQNAPAWDAIMEAKVELVLGHLWLEELAAGDSGNSRESIQEHFTLALWHLKALQQGGKKEAVSYQALTDATLIGLVKTAVADLKTFIQTANRRIELVDADGKQQAGSGSAVDQAFDTEFEQVMADLTALEQQIGLAIAADNRKIQDHYVSVKHSIITSLIIGLLASILIAGFIAHSVSTPLANMAVFIPKVAEGDLSRKVAVNSTDELGVVGRAINSMVDKLAMLIIKVQESGIHLSSALTQLAASSKEQEATAAEHAASTSEVAASVKEISATSIELGKKMAEVNKLSHETALAATDGNELLDQMDATMNRINEASRNISAKLADMSDKAGNITNMVTTINKVADQTNLLSLNAAIEAEKAGEYGLGFSVVATEIRRLADQTAVATYDIEQVVGEVQSAVSAGVMSMDKFTDELENSISDSRHAGDQMSVIVDQIQSLAPHVEAVNEGLQLQLQGSSQISDVITNLSEAAKHSAESARETNDTIRGLHETARQLHEAAAIFEIKRHS